MIEAFRQTPVDIPIPDEIRNYPKIAWKNLAGNGGVAATAGEYVDRTDEANRPIPHICFKVPTGGGKNPTRCRRIGTACLGSGVLGPV